MTVSISSGGPGETCSLDRPRCSEGASQGHILEASSLGILRE